MSNVDQDGEWKFRKITLMGVVRSFVSQLRPGQDLTRVSLPAVLLYPYSLLEVIGYRELTFFEVLLQLNKEEDPLQRTLIVIKWLLCTIQQETFHKKPYNPLLGETHECHIESSDYGRSDFISEQVSHHPPISAFIATNSQENVNLSGNISFNVKFGGNLVNVVTEGPAMVTAEERMEQYELSKSLPDMTIKNVIWGTKRIFWSGEMTINCPKTGYSVNLLFKESGSDNVVKGTISNIFKSEQGDLYSIDGKLGGIINYIDLKKNEKKLLIDVEAIKKPKITYQGKEKLDPLASLAIWADVSKYIIENDMEKADEYKKKIEQDQRVRVAERKANGLEQVSKYFQGTEFGWVFKHLSAKTKNTLTYSEDISDDDSDKDPFDDEDEEEEEEEEKKVVIPPQKREKTRSPDREPEKPSTPRSMEDSKTRTPIPISIERKDDTHEDEARSPKLEHPRLLLQVAKSSSSSLPQSNHSPKSNPINMSASYGDLERKKDSDSHDEDEKRFKGWTNPVKKARNAFKRESTQEKELIKQEKKRLREETRKSLSSKHGNDGEEAPVMQGWMKMRNSMKIWVNRFFVLKGGKLIYYSDERDVAKERCAGILRLAHCEIRQRTTKDSSAFKIAHTLHYPIYHKYGLRGETLKLAMLPVSWNFCILRVSNERERKQWIAAIHEQIAYANEHDSDPPPMAKEFHAMNAMNGLDDDDDVFSEGEEEKIFSSPEPERADKALNYERATKEEEAQLSGSPPNIVVDSPSSTVKKRSKKSARAKAAEISADLGPEDAFFAKHESLHRNMMDGFASDQKKVIKQLHQQTAQTVEQWKRETDMKMATMEKRLTTSMAAKDKTAKAVSLSYLQLAIVVIVCILVGRLLAQPWGSHV